jgi:hypothetical protein
MTMGETATRRALRSLASALVLAMTLAGRGGGAPVTVGSGSAGDTPTSVASSGTGVTGCEGFPSPVSPVFVCDTFTESGCIGAYCDSTYEWVTLCTESSCTCTQTKNTFNSTQTLATCTCTPTGPNICTGEPKTCCPFAP